MLLAVLVAILVLATSPGLSNQIVSDEVLRARVSTISLVRINEHGVFVRFCSGAVVEGFIYTAGHCVSDQNSSYYIQDYRGVIYTAVVLAYKFEWPDDWAVLKTYYSELVPSIGRSTDDPKLGHLYFAWSGPYGFNLLLMHGIYSGKIFPNDMNNPLEGMDYYSIPGAGGSSGSIILNSKGEAVGIITGKFVAARLRATVLEGVLASGLPPADVISSLKNYPQEQRGEYGRD